MQGEHDASERVDLYGAQYGNFRTDLLAAIRAEAFGEDYGQNGWQTVDEQDRFVVQLRLGPDTHLLDVACGSGGPTLRIAERTGGRVTGIDLHEDGVATARRAADERGLGDRAEFRQVDARRTLPFEDGAFDAVLCVDAINHLYDRASVLEEFARVLRPGGRLLYADPIVVTGWLTDEEMRTRSSIGPFLFVPLGVNEALLEGAGFELEAVEDRTENMAVMAGAWHAARAAREDDLRALEGDAAFEGQQTFLDVTARLAAERRLSRLVFLARRP